jgi:hypothetical protein
MNAEAVALPNINEREGFRLPFQGEFEYTCDKYTGSACWSSVSPKGACIRMERYLKTRPPYTRHTRQSRTHRKRSVV